jgi:hypothetical protein
LARGQGGQDQEENPWRKELKGSNVNDIETKVK